MLVGLLALVVAAAFAGAAAYVGAVEHPARLQLDDAALIREWKPSYRRGAAMQASLALIGFVFGAIAAWQSGDNRWLLGAVVLAANWPFTLIAVMPTNRKLKALDPAAPSPQTRALMARWGSLHGVRTVLGITAMLLFLWAAAG